MAGKTHYETLGVKPDASPAEIKRAYRSRAEVVHPDKPGGSHEKMAELAYAKEVLLNPARRELYDTTGQDDFPPTESQANSLIMSLFMDGIAKDVPNLLHHAKEMIKKAKQELNKQNAGAPKLIARMKRRRDAIKPKQGRPNLLQMLVDQQIPQIEQGLAAAKLQMEVVLYAEKELNSYKSEEALVQVVGWTSTASATTGNW